MAAHARHLKAGSGRLLGVAAALALLLAPAAAAERQFVPDEAALIEYVDALPTAEGPVRADGAQPGPTRARLNVTAVDGLSTLPPERAAALRKLAGRPEAPVPALAQRVPLSAAEPSTAGAVGSALESTGTPSLVLAILLVAALGVAVGVRVSRKS